VSDAEREAIDVARSIVAEACATVLIAGGGGRAELGSRHDAVPGGVSSEPYDYLTQEYCAIRV